MLSQEWDVLTSLRALTCIMVSGYLNLPLVFRGLSEDSGKQVATRQVHGIMQRARSTNKKHQKTTSTIISNPAEGDTCEKTAAEKMAAVSTTVSRALT